MRGNAQLRRLACRGHGLGRLAGLCEVEVEAAGGAALGGVPVHVDEVGAREAHAVVRHRPVVVLVAVQVVQVQGILAVARVAGEHGVAVAVKLYAQVALQQLRQPAAEVRDVAAEELQGVHHVLRLGALVLPLQPEDLLLVREGMPPQLCLEHRAVAGDAEWRAEVAVLPKLLGLVTGRLQQLYRCVSLDEADPVVLDDLHNLLRRLHAVRLVAHPDVKIVALLAEAPSYRGLVAVVVPHGPLGRLGLDLL
mmetsp:Transcript_77506/g.205784  ORF Transcript_77506/g.205784 Transcript_77506/m.205784 type:complete len:251 (-) Transcript_77506:105-857(-)